MEDLELLIIRE